MLSLFAMEENQIIQKKTAAQSFWELVRFAFMTLLVVIPMRMFVLEPFVVSGSSMVPTFANGDYLIIDKISYELGNPKRDDVVIFRYPKDQTKFYIKRVIGLPSETVDISGNNITIINKEYPEGFKLNQPFVKNTANNNIRFELKSNEYFVMGDNRAHSADSRQWGDLPKENIIGKVFLRVFPLGDFGAIKTPIY